MGQPPQHQDVEALYRLHQPWLKCWLTRKLGDPHGAEDVAQNVFMELLAGCETALIEEPRAFLTTLAQRALVSRWRRERLERAYLESVALLSPAHAPSPEARAIVIETLIQVDQLLEGLPAPVKQAFLLSQLDGLRQAEIAECMQLSLATVKRYLAKAALHCCFSDAARDFLAVA